MALIELTDVICDYGGSRALDRISMDVQSGDTLALLGPNGSGKSTLLKLLCGVITVSSGNYRFDGKNVTAQALRDQAFALPFHKRINLVFQNTDAQLFCASVYEEIAFGPRQLGFSQEDTESRVKDCLEMLDITHLKHREPFHLSEGEKRRVAIASILAVNPDVLALDEPMDGLDPRTKRHLRELLLELKSAGKTIICATHEFNYVEDVFEHAAVFGPEHNLIRTGLYRDILSDSEFLVKANLA